MRPAHIHFIVGARGFEPVTTHIFVEGDEYLDSDAVFGVKDSLIEPFVPHDDPAEAKKLGLGNPFYTASHEFKLVRRKTK
jgi:hydroxyquinol 1,2-dioxygenase